MIKIIIAALIMFVTNTALCQTILTKEEGMKIEDRFIDRNIKSISFIDLTTNNEKEKILAKYNNLYYLINEEVKLFEYIEKEASEFRIEKVMSMNLANLLKEKCNDKTLDVHTFILLVKRDAKPIVDQIKEN